MSYEEIDSGFIKPELSLWGELITTAHEPTDELADEVLAFYDRMLVPDFVCSPGASDRPFKDWLMAEGRKIVVCRSLNGTMRGCLVLKEHAILYPCLDVTKGKPGAIRILKLLAYKSFEEEGQELHAATDNAIIHAWIRDAAVTMEEGRPENMPVPKVNGGRVEWRD